jgi:hypothetical protein
VQILNKDRFFFTIVLYLEPLLVFFTKEVFPVACHHLDENEMGVALFATIKFCPLLIIHFYPLMLVTQLAFFRAARAAARYPFPASSDASAALGVITTTPLSRSSLGLAN